MKTIGEDTLNTIEENQAIKRGFAKFSRRLIFWLIFFINLFNHLDHGAIAASTTFLMDELNLDHADIGFIGSLVYLGLTCGATFAGWIFNNYTPKWIVSSSILASCFFLYSMTDSKGMLGLCISRLCCGFFQVFSMIYFPVWIDQYGVYESRTIWLSYLQLGPALGTMLGYAIEAISIRKFNNWRYGFYFQSIALIIATIFFLLTPDKVFDRNYKRTNLTRELIKANIEPNDNIYKEYRVINGMKYGRLSDFSIFALNEEEESDKNGNFSSTLRALYNNKIYLSTVLGICCLLFIITGIEFWITNYMHIILHQDVDQVYVTFAIVCISAPTLGVLIGGYLIEQLGGYTDIRALETCFKCSIIAGGCGMPLPFVNHYWIFTILMWFTLFFGGSIMPGLTGILLSSIPDDSKEESNSITHMCYNLIGYLPAPVLYGVVCNVTGGNESRWGLIMLMSFTILGMYFLKNAKDAQALKNENEKTKNILSQESGYYTFRQSLRKNSYLLSNLYGKPHKSDYFFK